MNLYLSPAVFLVEINGLPYSVWFVLQYFFLYFVAYAPLTLSHIHCFKEETKYLHKLCQNVYFSSRQLLYI